MKIELRQLRQFIAVSEALNFSRAAEQLAVAQPALSRGIQLLEHQLGVKLLLRNNRRVELTEAGRTFLTGCRGLMNDLEEAVRKARKAQDGSLGTLSIGYTDFAISGALPSLLDRFRQTLPEVGLDLLYGPTHQQINDLRTGKIDVGFLSSPLKGDDKFVSLPVQRDRFVAVLPLSHPLARDGAVEIRSLANEPFIFGVMTRWQNFRRHVDALCLKAGFAPRVVQEAYNTESIFGLVSANIGVTIHLECAKNYVCRGVAILPLADVDDLITTEAVWRANGTSAVLSRFVEFLLTPDRDNTAGPP